MDEVTQLETQLQISLELPFTSLYKEPDSSSLEHQFFLKAFQTFHSDTGCYFSHLQTPPPTPPTTTKLKVWTSVLSTHNKEPNYMFKHFDTSSLS